MKYFETDSSFCGLHRPILQSLCCLPATTAAPTTAPTAKTVTTSLPTDVQLLNPTPATAAATSSPSDSHLLNHTVETLESDVVENQEGGDNGKVNIISISAIAISSVAAITLAALAICFLRKRASKAQDPIMTPEGGIPTAVAMQVDPEAAVSQPSVWEMKMRPPPNAETPAHVSPSAPPLE